MTTRETKLPAADDEADIVQVILDDQRRPIAARANRDRSRWYVVDPSAEQDLADLARHGAGDISIISDSADRRMMSVFFERDTESGDFGPLHLDTLHDRETFCHRRQPVAVPLP